MSKKNQAQRLYTNCVIAFLELKVAQQSARFPEVLNVKQSSVEMNETFCTIHSLPT